MKNQKNSAIKSPYNEIVEEWRSYKNGLKHIFVRLPLFLVLRVQFILSSARMTWACWSTDGSEENRQQGDRVLIHASFDKKQQMINKHFARTDLERVINSGNRLLIQKENECEP
uniref:Transposase n=1 Tax=Steinernema glaseri TaxID=37863 RepID=A0A1I8A953_9BILA